jgi:hypothetical protein
MKNYGLVIKDKRPTDYKFGSNLPLKEINETAQWDESLPEYESQADKYERWSCTIHGTQNQIEIMLKFLYGKEYNFLEWYNYNIVEIVQPGADPNLAYDSIREFGLIETGKVKINDDTYEDFCTPRPMTDDIKAIGKQWLDSYELGHEWVQSSNPDSMKDLIKHALHYSPVALSVTAWFQDENGLYIDRGMTNNHWCVCYGYRDTPEGVVLKIFDSYDHSTKELHPSHNVMIAKRITIKKKITAIPKSFWSWFLKEKLIYREFKKFLINLSKNK